MRRSKRGRWSFAMLTMTTGMAFFTGSAHADDNAKKPKHVKPLPDAGAPAAASATTDLPPPPPAPMMGAETTPAANAGPAATPDSRAATVGAQGQAATTLPDGSHDVANCAGDDCPNAEHWDLSSVLGIRLALMSASAPASKTTFGAMLWGGSDNYRTTGVFALRTSALVGLGGGSGGLEGALGGTLALGIRVPVAEHHGPVIRIGLGGELLGNSQFYYSHIDLPIGELGYQFTSGHTIFEIGGRAAPLITGRYNTGDAFHRELGTSLEWGGYVAAHAAFGRIDANYMRIQDGGNDPGTALDILRGNACAYASKLVAFCLDAMYLHGGEQSPLAAPGATASPVAYPGTSTFYGGVMAGFSADAFQDDAPKPNVRPVSRR